MPGFNGAGPLGNGPGTGWGQGPCMGSNVSRNSRGFGTRRGNMGRGRRNRFCNMQTWTTPQTTIINDPIINDDTNIVAQQGQVINELKQQIANLQQQVKDLQKN